MKLSSTAAFEALSDIGHNRYGSSLDLPGKPKIFCKRSLLRHLIRLLECSSRAFCQAIKSSNRSILLSTQPSSLSTVF